MSFGRNKKIKSNLFLLQNVNDKYVFLNQPNLNRILLTKIENVKDKEVVELEHQLLKNQMIGDKFKIYLWPSAPKDIPDTQDLKLVVIREKNQSFMNDVIERKGEAPRVYRNMIFFLTPIETERSSFSEVMKRRIAYVDTDKTLNLNDTQRNEIRNNLKKDVETLNDAIRRFYRIVYVPARDGFKEIDLGIPTYGENRSVDYDVYDKEMLSTDRKEVIQRFKVPRGKISEIMRVMNYFQTKFQTLEIEIKATDGHISEEDFTNKIKEALFQLGIDL
jgi:hypothetical protein